MSETRLQTTSQLQSLVAGAQKVRFCVPDSDDDRYAHIVSVAQLLEKLRVEQVKSRAPFQ